ncbi:MAG: Nif11-like leader peptide family natural product precursor [Oscillospiraceae bacterium]|nr:Nif11-like leader peptide family natural product precursor [Oscillospiraceae bacterium]
MEQMQAFIEKARNDSSLMAKLDELGSAGAEDEKIIALAAEHGFSITVEECRAARESAGACKTCELAEEDLESAAGGGTRYTQNRYDPEICKKYTTVHYNCVGFIETSWCDHYTRTKITETEGHHKCSMGVFDYKGGKRG